MVKRIKLSLAVSALALTLFSGCGDIGNEGANSADPFKEVRLVSVSPEPLIEVNASTNQAILAGSVNFGLSPTDADYKTAFGIKSYKIIYTTTDESGADINASGLVTIPVPTAAFLEASEKAGSPYSMSLISDQHGTIFTDAEAPSNTLGGLGAFMTAIMSNQTPQSTPLPFLMSAIGGFITLQPDYIGYGASKGFHPYLLEKSSASSTVDIIKSTMKFASAANIPFNGQVYLSGYSEGGYVTMAAAKEIEANHPMISLKGIAPMAAPYDLNATGMGVLAPNGADFDTNMSRPDFIGGIVYSHATAAGLDLTTIVNEPYATTLPTLYDANHTGEEIRAELTESITDFFVPSYRMSYLTTSDNSLKQSFLANTPLDWAPKTKVKLLHCTNDEVISSQLSQIAYARLTANGSTSVELDLIDTVSADALPSVHVKCGEQTYPAAVAWFSQIRTGEIK